MVDYSIDIGDEGVAYEQAVNMPSASTAAAAVEGAVKIGDGLFKTLDAYDSAKKASAPTESSIKREAFSKFAQRINNAKSLSPLRQRTEVNAAIIEMTNAGFDIGQAEKDLVQVSLGMSLDYLNFDPNQKAIDGALKFIDENPAILRIAKDKLDATEKTYTQADLLSVAVKEAQKVEAAQLFIANAEIVDEAQFRTEFYPSFKVAIDTLQQQIVAGLKIEAQAGRDVRPENIPQLRIAITQLRAQLTGKIPPNLKEGVTKPLFDQLDILEKQLENLQNYDKDVIDEQVADFVNRNTKVLLKFVEENVNNPILADALLTGKFDATQLLQGELTKFTQALEGLEKEDFEYTDLFTYVDPVTSSSLQTGGASTPENVDVSMIDNPTTENLHDAEEIDKKEELSMGKRKDLLFFTSIEQLNLVKPSDMNILEHRNNFIQGIGQASLTIATSPEIFKVDTLNNIFKEELYQRLQILDLIDPTQAMIARERLADALKAQLRLVSSAEAGSNRGSFFKVDGVGKIIYDLESRVDTGQIRMDKEVLPLVKGFASKYYNGDVTQMIADRAIRLTTFERTQIENAGFNLRVAFQDYRKILKISNRKKYYTKNLRRLGKLTGQLEESLIRDVEVKSSAASGTLQNPWKIEWSDNTDSDEKLFASIGKGEYYTDINGDVRIKN